MDDLQTSIETLFNSLYLQTNNHSVQSMLDSMVSKYLANKGYHSVDKLVSGNFSAMVTPREASKNPDLVLNFAKYIYERRSGTDDSLMQLNRMPFGLIDLVCWSLTSLCHSNGHIETMPVREINPFTADQGSIPVSQDTMIDEK